MEEERSASDIMDSLNFTSEQKKAVDRVITAYNECGAAYGAVAYRFGMEDGIRVRMEMEEIMRFLKYWYIVRLIVPFIILWTRY